MYEAGSAEPATWTKTICLHTEPFASVRTADHPGGGVTTAVPKTRIEATSTSPATTAGGRGIASLLLAEIAFPAAPRKTIPPAGVVVTVQLNVSVASAVCLYEALRQRSKAAV